MMTDDPIVEAYLSDMPMQDIERDHGVSISTVYARLRENDVMPDRKHRRRQSAIDNRDMEKVCRKCGVLLDDENWYPSNKKGGNYICKSCMYKHTKAYRVDNRDKYRAYDKAFHEANRDKVLAHKSVYRRKLGILPMSENRSCAQFLGVHVAERVLSHVFKDVKRMPNNTPGFDFVCNRGKKIDVKSSCLRHIDGCSSRWGFGIERNTTADFFLCLAFDNRKDLTPLHMWLIPGSAISSLKNATISQSTLSKWDAYSLPVSKVISCCSVLKGDTK